LVVTKAVQLIMVDGRIRKIRIAVGEGGRNGSRGGQRRMIDRVQDGTLLGFIRVVVYAMSFSNDQDHLL
jgi:hypothetical protein